MLQPEFLTELFSLAKEEGLSTLIDSNGTIPFQEYPKLVEVTDGVMLDIKAFNCEEHKNVTGTGNETVLENAVWLAEHKKLYEVRAVIVPGLYDTENSIRKMGEFLSYKSDCLPANGGQERICQLSGSQSGLLKQIGGYSAGIWFP